MNEAPRFSGKILLFSLVVLLVNITLFSALFYGQKQVESLNSITPHLVFEEGQSVQVQSLFDSDFVPASSGQLLFAGSRIQTGPGSEAQILIDEGMMRLDSDTTVVFTKNHFTEQAFMPYSPSPRLVFSLVSGEVLVDAQLPIRIETPRAATTFVHSSGSYAYTDAMSRIAAVSGGIDLTLRGEQADLAHFFIPFRHQVSFSDSQLTEDYARLQVSKLKKELHLTSIFGVSSGEKYVVDERVVDYFVPSGISYFFRDYYFSLAHRLAWTPESKVRFVFLSLQNKMNYLVNHVKADPDFSDTEVFLSEIDSLKKRIPDLLLRNYFQEMFYALGSIDSHSSAFSVQRYLRSVFVSQMPVVFLRSYLDDVGREMDRHVFDGALVYANLWLKQWTPSKIASDFNEFENQSVLYHSFLLAYADQIPESLLTPMEDMTRLRLEYSPHPQETLFTLAEERLRLDAAFIAHFRYSLAGSYLEPVYPLLADNRVKASDTALHLFLQQADLLSEKIAFAEREMHGAAEAIDLSKFREYLEWKSRDKTLSENLEAFLSDDNTLLSSGDSIIGVDRIVTRFGASRIVIDSNSVQVTPEFPSVFLIKNARLVDYAADGTLIVFDGMYDFNADAVYNIQVNGIYFNGNFALGDVVRVLSEGYSSLSENGADSAFFLDLFGNQNDEALRAQSTTRDLALQLVNEQLKQAGVYVTNADQITPLSTSVFTDFHVSRVLVSGHEAEFDLNLDQKKVTHFVLYDSSLEFPSSIFLADLIFTIQKVMDRAQQQKFILESAYQQLVSRGFSLKQSDLAPADTSDRFSFKELGLKTLPFTVNGVYDSARDIFVEVTHSLLSEKEVSPEPYFNKLIVLWVIDVFKKQEISLQSDQISTSFPFSVIAVNGFEMGEQILHFEVDLRSSLIKNISIEGQTGVLDSLSFSEFRQIIEGAQASSSVQM